MQIPREAWWLAWACVIGQALNLAENGRQDDNLLVPSMLLGAAVVAWFSYGVLRARMVRVVLAGIIFAVGVLGYLVDLIDNPDGWALIHLVSTIVTMAAFVAFVRTPYFAWQRSRPDGPPPALGGLIAMAVVVGAIGGVVGAGDDGIRAEVSV